MASFSCGHGVRIGVCVCVCVCVCVWLQQATYIVANTARNFSEPRRTLSCNSLCRGPIVRMFMQLVVWCGVVMQLYCVVQSVRQLSAMCRMFRKNYTLYKVFRILGRVRAPGSQYVVFYVIVRKLRMLDAIVNQLYKYSNVIQITLFIYLYYIYSFIIYSILSYF